jgi:hypothetical protein
MPDLRGRRLRRRTKPDLGACDAVLGPNLGRKLASDRLNTEPPENGEQVVQAALAIVQPVRAPATPEHPPEPLKRPLAALVFGPPLRPMIAAAIKLNGETPVTLALDHEIDPEATDLELRADPVAQVQQASADITLEPGIAGVQDVLRLRDRGALHGLPEILDHRRLQVLGQNRHSRIPAISRFGDTGSL